MAPTKEITNLIKDVEKNLKEHIQITIDEALKKQEIMFKQKTEEIFLKLNEQEKKFEEIINSQNFLNQELETVKRSVKDINNLELPKKAHILMKEVETLKKHIVEHEKMHDALDQYQRRENLEFHGIPVTLNENTNHIIKTMVKKLNVDLKEDDISTSHRLPSANNRTPGIIVKFTNRDLRNLIYQKRRNLIGVNDFKIPGMTNLFINENLTPMRRKLFSLVFKKKIELKYKFLWTQNGDIYVRKNTTCEKLKISTEADLDLIK